VRVGVDGRSLVGGGARGVAHYTAALLEALAAAFPDDEYRVLLPRGPASVPGDAAAHAPHARAARVPGGVTPVPHPLPARVLFGAAAVAGRPRLERLLGGDCDVLWAPAPAPLAIGATPFVLTVHDRSWETRPRDFTLYERLWHRAARPRRLARRATRVLCVSETVRRELIAAWRLDPGRVRAIPLAPRPVLSGAGSVARPPYFLFVGALEPRKAPEVLLDGYLRARERGLEAELVVAGEGRVAVEGPRVRRLGRVDDLGPLYAGALAVVLPSWLEGFGLPPVEGIAAGAPAIVSDLPVFREVLGDGALYVRPGDAPGLADALLRVERDAALRERLLTAGRAAIAPLSWAETARRTRAVLAEAAAA
jgi:glycosyltransferase involved in cell wall biosynthesis